jgi:hypothetical protein
MRTKTLALSTMLGALGTASLVAQTNVYSINAVGYINLTLPAGYSIIACQLQTTNNTIAGLFQNGPTMATPGKWNGSKVLVYNPADGRYDVDDIASSSYSSGWISGGTITMNPGQAVWFDNGTGSAQTVTFVGTVPQGTNTVTMGAGYNMVSSPVPFSGDLVTNMGLTNYALNGTKVLTFNGANNPPYTSYISSTSGSAGYMNQWLSPGDPQINVGQGFWVSSPSPVSWVQIFSINP